MPYAALCSRYRDGRPATTTAIHPRLFRPQVWAGSGMAAQGRPAA